MNIKEITDRNDKLIKCFIDSYSISEYPIEISFREIMPEIKSIDRYTHLIHSYPAKLLVHIPYFFLNNTIFSKQGDSVLDPFNGSGTVVLEGIVAKRNAFGADSNPLARLISEVKVTKFNTTILSKETESLILRAIRKTDSRVPNVVNCSFWFPERTKLQLSKLLSAIKDIKDESVRKFMLVSFSNCVKKVSYADQRVSVPVKLNPSRYEDGSDKHLKILKRLKELEDINVFDRFKNIAKENIIRFKKIETLSFSNCEAKIISNDARKLSDALEDKTIQLIITSPPYAGAQKYIRASSLNLGWTELAEDSELVNLERITIGREHYRKVDRNIYSTGIEDADKLINEIKSINLLRAKIISNYIHEMIQALNEMVRVLKEDGYLVLIVGNNKVCNREFNTQDYFSQYLENQGMKLQFKLIDDIKSFGLMTKRNKTADIISREWILVFKKQRL